MKECEEIWAVSKVGMDICWVCSQDHCGFIHTALLYLLWGGFSQKIKIVLLEPIHANLCNVSGVCSEHLLGCCRSSDWLLQTNHCACEVNGELQDLVLMVLIFPLLYQADLSRDLSPWVSLVPLYTHAPCFSREVHMWALQRSNDPFKVNGIEKTFCGGA